VTATGRARRPGRVVTVLSVLGLVLAGALLPLPAFGAAPPDVRLSVSSDEVRVGEPIRITWDVVGGETLQAVGDWRGTLPASGTRTLRPHAPGLVSFGLRASNTAGAVLVEVDVEVLRRPADLVLRAEPFVLRGLRTPVVVRGLAAREEYAVRLDGREVARGRADRDGVVDRGVEIPAAGREGVRRLVVIGSAPGRVGSAVVQVVAPRRLPIRLALAEVEGGRDQTATVRGLGPREPVTVRHRGVVVATGRADARGSFTATFDVGPGWGSTTVAVRGAFPARHGDATFDVVPRTPDLRTELR
jgi:hypothetical protein